MKILKGQGSLIISVIVMSLFVLIVLPTTMYLIIRTPYSNLSFVPEIRSEFVEFVSYTIKDINATVFVDRNNVITLAIANYGTSEINVINLFYRLLYPNGTTVMLREETNITVRPNSATSYQSYEILRYCEVSCRLVSIMLLTDKGTTITPRMYSEEFLEELMVSQEVALVKMHAYLPLPYYDPSSIRDTLSRSGFKILDASLLEIPRQGVNVRGIKGVRTGAYYLYEEYVNVDSISVTNAPVGNLYLGYNPKDVKKYDIMFSWNRASSDVILVISGQSVNLGSVCSNGYRVKIVGFKNATRYIIRFSNGVEITSPSPDPAKYSYLTSRQGVRISFTGSAERVRIYCRSSNLNYETSYEPYMLLTKFNADAPGASILFVTEDVYYGFATSRNDAYSSGKILQDYSTVPLVLIYNSSTTTITNSKYLGVILVVNYRFHDNEGNDFYGVSSDRVIFEVGLVDSEGNVLSNRTFTFKELTRYEDTYPPRAQAQSASIFIPLPRPESSGETKAYYPFIKIQEPYGGSGNLDDLDIMLLIEGLGVILVS